MRWEFSIYKKAEDARRLKGVFILENYEEIYKACLLYASFVHDSP